MGITALKCRDNGRETEAGTGSEWINTCLQYAEVAIQPVSALKIARIRQ